MLKKYIGVIIILLAIGILLGCASSGKPRTNPTNYNRNVGTAYPLDMKTKTVRILNKFNYVVVRQEESFEQIYYETDWRYRQPFDDEIDLGIVDARTRLTVTATPRTRVGTDLYNVRVRAETQVRFQDTEEFTVVPMSDLLIKYLNDISDDLKMELSTGIRRY